MAQFTRRLSELINSGFDLGMTSLDYPIFDEAYREKLNKKILKHYWNYEIGHETEDMFRFALNRKLNEIMPYYNQLYTSTQLTFDPLKTISYTDISDTTDHLEGTRTETTDNTATANSKARNVNSDTPQVLLSPNEDYASSAVNTIAENDSSTNSSVDGSNTNDATGSVNRSVQGYQGLSASELLQRFRATFLNIDMNVIKDLEELFMMLWHNGDEYSEGVGISYGIPFGYFPIF